MIFWNFYFITKAWLHFAGYIRAHFLLNALLFTAAALPLPAKLPRAALLGRLRQAVCATLALALIWSESWLPSPGTVWHFFSDPSSRPSLEYSLRFLASAVNPLILAAAAGVLLASLAAARLKLRLAPLSMALIALMGFTGFKPASSGIDAFHESEAGREVRLDKAGSGKPDFDIIVIHVCSLSWDDLAHVKFDARPFFSGFDYLFTGFNSATSYSNPAATRLLQAPCGQRPHAAIFGEQPPNCYLTEALRERGYKIYTLLNHDGKYDGYMEKLARNAKAAPMYRLDLKPEKLNFDETPIFSDREELTGWFDREAARSPSPVFLFYNTISMHQGAHYIKAPGLDPWAQDRPTRYSEFLRALTSELGDFFARLRASGRKAVVIFVPEHGAALAGSRLQAGDLRDIPFHQITLVPVGIKLFGPGYNGRPPLGRTIDKPVSYLALAKVLEDFLTVSPYKDPEGAARLLAGSLPETQPVSENETAIVMKSGDGYVYKAGSSGWLELPKDMTPEFTGARYMREGPLSAAQR
jgi:hypothetical protein